MICQRCKKRSSVRGRRSCKLCIDKHGILKDARAWKKLYFKKESYTCAYCQEVFPTLKLTIDHKIPVSRGGKDIRANIHLVCSACNRIKGDFTHIEFLKLMACFGDDAENFQRLRKRLLQSGFLFSRK